MLKSIINGATTTPAQLAKEIVFYHGEYAVIALPSILGAAGMKATDREFGLVSEQVVKILARVSRLLNHDAKQKEPDHGKRKIRTGTCSEKENR